MFAMNVMILYISLGIQNCILLIPCRGLQANWLWFKTSKNIEYLDIYWFDSTLLTGVSSSTNWPQALTRNSILNWVLKLNPLNQKVKLFRLRGESLIIFFFTFRSHQWYKTAIQREIRDLKKKRLGQRMIHG